MVEMELHGNSDGYVLCPVRGEVPVAWCARCGHLSYLDRRGDRALVVCTVDLRPFRLWPEAPFQFDDSADFALTYGRSRGPDGC